MAVAGFSMELASGALTRCQGLALTTLCRHADAVIASDGARLYRLSGETDDGATIPIRLSLPATDCGKDGAKRLRTVRLEGCLGGQVTVTAVSETGARQQGEAGPAGEPHLPGSALARLGRGSGRFWRLEVTGEDGAALDIGALVVGYASLDRREW